jgi:hypothetical protein
MGFSLFWRDIEFDFLGENDQPDTVIVLDGGECE